MTPQTKIEIWDLANGQPPSFARFARKPITRAWSASTLVILQVDRLLVHICLSELSPGSLTIRMESIPSDSDVRKFDNLMGQNVFVETLCGHTVEGMDADVLVFSGGYGVRFLPSGLHWVRAMLAPPGVARVM